MEHIGVETESAVHAEAEPGDALEIEEILLEGDDTL